MHPYRNRLPNWLRQMAALVLLLSGLHSFCYGQGSTQKTEAVNAFIQCVKDRDVDCMSSLMEFPFWRKYPVREITNAEEFKARFNQVMDEELLSEIAASDPQKDWSAVGSRGIAFNRRGVWIDFEGGLFAVNYTTQDGAAYRAELIRNEQAAVHPSITFETPILMLETGHLHIRIDQLADGSFQFASWSKPKTIADKPDLILSNGNYERQGNVGNGNYAFTDDLNKYVCVVNAMYAEHEWPFEYKVFKAEELILSTPASQVFLH